MNEEKLLAVYESLEPRLRVLACRILGQSSPDAEDALQNAMLKAWLKCHAIRNELCLTGWLCRIVRNECVTLLRQRARRAECLTDDFSKICIGSPMDEQVMNKQLFAYSLGTLCSPYSETIVLYYIHGFKVREIATILQRPENTVKGLLCRARQMMRKAG